MALPKRLCNLGNGTTLGSSYNRNRSVKITIRGSPATTMLRLWGSSRCSWRSSNVIFNWTPTVIGWVQGSTGLIPAVWRYILLNMASTATNGMSAGSPIRIIRSNNVRKPPLAFINWGEHPITPANRFSTPGTNGFPPTRCTKYLSRHPCVFLRSSWSYMKKQLSYGECT